MSIDFIKKRFVDEIKLRGYDDMYIDKNEEREILQIAIQQGVGIESAREAMADVCAQHGYVLESVLIKEIRTRIDAMFGEHGMIDQDQFESVVVGVRHSAGETRNDRDIRKLIVTVMEDSGLNKVRTGWIRNWYTSLKKELGVS